MLKSFSKIHVPKSFDVIKNRDVFGCFNPVNKQFCSGDAQNSSHSDRKNHASKHRSAFHGLQARICRDSTHENMNKYTMRDSTQGFQQNLYEQWARENESYEDGYINSFQQPSVKAPYESLRHSGDYYEAIEVDKEGLLKWENLCRREARKNGLNFFGPKVVLKEAFSMVTERVVVLGKVAGYIAESWEQTFPKDKFKAKIECIKRMARERVKKEKEMKQYTEEEILNMQEAIPEYKRTAIVSTASEVETEEQASNRKKVLKKIADKLNETEAAKHIYNSDKYKDYQEFKKEISQFKEDLKDHLGHSQNPADKVTAETNTGEAINQIRKQIPDFCLNELEMDAKGVFEQVYNAFLEGDHEFLDAVCDRSAGLYFKTLLRKQEIEKVRPKHTSLWDIEPADFIGGRVMTENNQSCFTFTIQVQEVYCNISLKNGKVVDGAEDRVLKKRFNFVLALHEEPVYEVVGHPWKVVEIHTVDTVQMLA